MSRHQKKGELKEIGGGTILEKENSQMSLHYERWELIVAVAIEKKVDRFGVYCRGWTFKI